MDTETVTNYKGLLRAIVRQYERKRDGAFLVAEDTHQPHITCYTSDGPVWQVDGQGFTHYVEQLEQDGYVYADAKTRLRYLYPEKIRLLLSGQADDCRKRWQAVVVSAVTSVIVALIIAGLSRTFFATRDKDEVRNLHTRVEALESNSRNPASKPSFTP